MTQTALSVDLLLGAARKAAGGGLTDFGDRDFETGLKLLVEDLNAGSAFKDPGSPVRWYSRPLRNRLQIQDSLKRWPEIRDVPIKRPLFVVGPPRSGTTFLHRLISQSPTGRPLLTWELNEPAPPVETATWHTDPRIARMREGLARMPKEIRLGHELDAEAPEECRALLRNTMTSYAFLLEWDLPKYHEWLRHTDMSFVYEYLKMQYQLLTFRCPGDYLILKAPVHVFCLPTLLKTFPDASVIHIHRDPYKVFGSYCSLSNMFRTHRYETVDRNSIGRFVLKYLTDLMDSAIKYRDTLDPARFYDLKYRDLVTNPVQTVAGICQHFGYPFDDKFKGGIQRWLDDNPQHKHGKHVYDIAEYGLDPDEVDAVCARYRNRFDVPEEKPRA